MSDDLINVDLEPNHIQSGATVTAKLLYESDSGGLLIVSADQGFIVSSPNVDGHTVTRDEAKNTVSKLLAGGGPNQRTDTLELTVKSTLATRATCTLVFKFVVNDRESHLTVDPPLAAIGGTT